MHNRWPPKSGFSKMVLLPLIRTQGCVDVRVADESSAPNTAPQCDPETNCVWPHWWEPSVETWSEFRIWTWRQFMCNLWSKSIKVIHVYNAPKNGKIILISHKVLGSDQGFKWSSWIYVVNPVQEAENWGLALMSLFSLASPSHPLAQQPLHPRTSLCLLV